nr:hypothetical protein [Tanacetum cinerariifolium]
MTTLAEKAILSGIPTFSDEFPLPEEVPTDSEEKFPLLKKRNAIADKDCTANEDKGYSCVTITLFKVVDPYLGNNNWYQSLVIEFGDSYEDPKDGAATGSASDGKKGRTVAVTTEDMQKRRNDVKARTTLLLALPDEHQLRFSKYKTAQELWAAILKTFGGNEATRKTKKNQLKQQYGNFKAEGKETLEQTFNRLQAIVSHLEFMDVEIEQDDLNKKFLTSLALEWLMYTIPRTAVGMEKLTLLVFLLLALKFPLLVLMLLLPVSVLTLLMLILLLNLMVLRLDTGRRLGKRSPYKVHMWLALISQRWSALTATRWATLQGSAGPPGAKKGVEEKTSDKNHDLVADEEAPSEIALMAKSSTDNEVFDDSLCSKACKKNTDSLNSKIIELSEKLGDTKNMPSPSVESNPNDLQNNSSSVFEIGESTSILSKPEIKFVKPADSLTVAKTNKDEIARKPTVKYAEMYRKTSKRPLMSTNRPNMNAAQPKRTSSYKPAYSYVNRPFRRKSAVRTQVTVPRVPTVNKNFPTVNIKFPTDNIDDKGYWDSGCSWHMTGNISYLSYYEPFDGGYVSFGQGGCKITGKGTIKTGKQHKASCKTKLVNSVTKPFYTLHMDLFGPTSDETSGILRNFITEIENLKELKNGVAERRNRTLIEAARTMLADAKLPVTFWAEAVNTACYVQNRVLVNKSQNKTPYELFNGRTPAIGSLRQKGMKDILLGINSTKFSGTKEAAGQDVNNAQDTCNADAPESSGNSNPTATSTNPPADHMETLAVETLILTEEGTDYDEVFAPVARIEAINLFLAYASFMGFTVYQMDVKSAFLYGTIDE